MRPTELSVAPIGSRWHVWLLGSTCVVLAVTVFLLSAANTQLEEAVKHWKRQAQWPAEANGFPILDTHHLDGTPQRVGALPGAQLLIVFTTSCPNCRANLPVWQDLTTRFEAVSANAGSDALPREAWWVSLSPRDSVETYVAEHGLSRERVVLADDLRQLRVARVRGVPLTVLLDSAGVTRFVHAGPFTQPLADSLLATAQGLHGSGTKIAPTSSRQAAFHIGAP